MTDNYTIKKLTTVQDMLPCYPLILQLSPDLTFEKYEALLRDMVPHNYFMVAVYDADVCIAISGYWICAKLYSGRYLEIDNLVVDKKYRSKGIGKLLMDWMTEEARTNHCETVMLDAYVENFKAHRFYYREGFIARGFHYLKKIN